LKVCRTSLLETVLQSLAPFEGLLESLLENVWLPVEGVLERVWLPVEGVLERVWLPVEGLLERVWLPVEGLLDSLLETVLQSLASC
jgi:hypothetical protein